MSGGAEHHDAQQDVPAGVEARHRGVLVDERPREDLPITPELACDGVYDSQSAQSRRRHREEREHEETDQPGDQYRVAQPEVVRPPEAEEQDAADDENGPMAVHVDGVRDVDQPWMAEHLVLQRRLPVQAEPAFHVRDVRGVRHRPRDVALGQRAHPEVREVAASEDQQLADSVGHVDPQG
jgi:hypothetical protein